MHDSVATAFTAFTVPLEARVRFMYLDTRQLVTTGIGNLIDQDDPEHIGSRARLTADAYDLGWLDGQGVPVGAERIDGEYKLVKESGTAGAPLPVREAITTLRISEEAVDAMVARRLASNEATLRGRAEFAGYADWPADAQLGLLSMAWAMGAGFGFPDFQAAVAGGDWLTAARESHMNETDNPGLRARNIRNGLLFTIASWVAAPPAGDLTALAYDPAMSPGDNVRFGPFPIPLNLDIGIQAALERLSADLGRPAYDPNGVDGVFGRGTRTALVRFQQDFGVPTTPDADGVAGIGADTAPAIAAALDERQIAHWP